MNGENVEKRNFNSIFEGIQKSHEERERLTWKGTFEEYIEKVVEHPEIVRNAQMSVYKAITSTPDFFKSGKNALYGSEVAVERFTELMRQGAEGYESGKRIILLLGPPGSGKSTLVNGTKRGMEAYSRTDEGAIYAIEGCQMHEDPLHLIPEDLRPTVEEEYGIKIEGSLCPQCEQKYGDLALDTAEDKSADAKDNEMITRLQDVPVERVFLSENRRIGIGTFKPSDPKSQDITELTGSVNLKGLEKHGVASDARAFNFDGELNIANRGVMEFVEILKSDPKFLYSLLDLAQDRTIKAGKFANISADEVIIAHTNLSEYNRFMADEKNEALRDRIALIEVPYALSVSSEKMIYEKLVGQTERIRTAKTHVSPRSLEIASMFSVLSRMTKSDKFSKVQKMAAYDGNTNDESYRDVTEMVEEGKKLHEGMSGVSPRFVIDAISNAMKDDTACLSPIDIVRALKNQLDISPYTKSMKEEGRKMLMEDLSTARELYDDLALREVQRAFTFAYEENAQNLCKNYVENVIAFNANEKIVDSTGIEREPNEDLMRSVELNMAKPVQESGKREYRRHIVDRYASEILKGNKDFDFMNYPGLREAIETKLFADSKDSLRLTLNNNSNTEGKQDRLNNLQNVLIEEGGYCEHCATELIDYASSLIQRIK